MSTSAKEKAATAAVARMRLLEVFKITPHQKVYSLVRHVAPSGMSRVLRFYVIVQRGDGTTDIGEISQLIARLCDFPYDTRFEGVRRRGTGADLAGDTVYELAFALFGDGSPLNKASL